MKKQHLSPPIIVALIFVICVAFTIAIRYYSNYTPVMGDFTGDVQDNSILTDGKININTATAEMLCMLPGIGETLAKRIVDYRTQHGPFETIEDLKLIKGISNSVYIGIEAYVTVEN